MSVSQGAHRFRRRRLKEDPFSPAHVNHVISLDSDKKEDPRAVVEAFKESEKNELIGFKRLRASNVQVSPPLKIFNNNKLINHNTIKLKKKNYL